MNVFFTLTVEMGQWGSEAQKGNGIILFWEMIIRFDLHDLCTGFGIKSGSQGA